MPYQPFPQPEGSFPQPLNQPVLQSPVQPGLQFPIRSKWHAGLIVILSVLALVLAGTGVFFGLKYFRVIGEENNKGDNTKEAVLEKIFDGVALAWSEPESVLFSTVKPLHIESRLAAADSSYVLVTGWDEQYQEFVVFDPDARAIVPIDESGLDFSVLEGETTDAGTFVVSVPKESADSPTAPITFGQESGSAVSEPVVIGAYSSRSAETNKEGEDSSNAEISTADFDLPAGLIAQPLIIGADSSGEANLIVAAQSVDDPQSCKLVDYSVDGTAQWVQDIDVSCAQVSASENGKIYVTRVDEGDVTIAEYASAPKPASLPAEEDFPSVVPADYIKQLDFSNLPARVSGWDFAYSQTYGDGGITFLKVPESLSGEGDENWYVMENGESLAHSYVHTFDVWSADLSLTSTVIDGFDVDYQDFDGDGFLDALVEYRNPGNSESHVYIFDPADPQHPWAAYVHGSQYLPLEYRDGVFRGEVDSCLRLRFTIERNNEGTPIISGYKNVEDAGFGTCISE